LIGWWSAWGESPTSPVHAVLLRTKLVGLGFEPFQAPLKPNATLPPLGIERF
jgi:hypothetical protein